MNEFVLLAAGPPLTRNSLTTIGLTLRTFSTAVSSCLAAPDPVQRACATRSPLNAAGPDVTLKVALTVAPGATASAMVAVVRVVPGTTDVHPFGVTMLSSAPVTGAPVVFVNETVVSCAEAGENVCRPGGSPGFAEAGAMPTRGTSYFAATTFACTF